jgi:L-lactate permease
LVRPPYQRIERREKTNMYLLFFIALIPIVGLMISLGVLKIPAHKAVPSTLAVTFY